MLTEIYCNKVNIQEKTSKCVLIFSTNLSENFLILRITEEYGQKCVLVLMQRTIHFCQIFKENGIFLIGFRKILN